ncbi:MAG: 3-deoxy-D-manno-octulosonic acid transferase [Victivallales bacterium]|nr:3-deoxy-D-manno-octulosonic acid transferase [Victivallales bacterium]
MLLLYNILFPLAFLFFVPGIVIKLIRRGGVKNSFAERFAIFADQKRKALESCRGCIWVHSVSVGETVLALALVKAWKEASPSRRFVLSTTTTTGQKVAQDGAPENVPVFFCPLDMQCLVKKVFKMLQPRALVILETEIWPNMICEARRSDAAAILVNARISDRSAGKYRRMSFFFSQVMRKLSLICVQTELDAERIKSIDKHLEPQICGNMKFDQCLGLPKTPIDVSGIFGQGENLLILAASTHPGEEKLVLEVFRSLKQKHRNLKLTIVPRHAERGSQIESQIKASGLPFARRSTGFVSAHMSCEVLLADTTGELLDFMRASDIVIMGKSLAGHDEGHNIIEPAMLGKPVVTGSKLRNFRQVLKLLRDDKAVVTVADQKELESELDSLVSDSNRRENLGKRALEAVSRHRGATERTIKLCEKTLS